MLVKPGSRVKVEVDIGDPKPIFHTVVRSCDPRAIELAAPTVNGKKVGVASGTKVTLIEVSSTGLLFIETLVEEVKSQPQALWLLKFPTLESIRRIQRRREARYEVDVHVRWKKSPDARDFEIDPLHVVNINTMGALVTTEKQLLIGEDILLDLSPLVQVGGTLTGQKVLARSKVVRQVGDSGRVFGVSFEALDRLQRSSLNEAIRRLKSRQV
ncbi:MAG: PilZ domain-containing protein [Candidatus Omnitrophica bacterium]|nr:hypothetical protein [bacterium]NUN97294.1 PilZ domain-containing protein [Candidatus Omnitrophota bacterium]